MNSFGLVGRCSVGGCMGVLFAFVTIVPMQNLCRNGVFAVHNPNKEFQSSEAAHAVEWSVRPETEQESSPAGIPEWLYGPVCTMSPVIDVSIDSTPVSSTADLLVDAVVMIESGGEADVLGAAGERGLMQIMPGTWEETTEKMFGNPIPFSRAFEPSLNREVGAYYLGEIQNWLKRHQSDWNSDLRSLILASYNAGFTTVMRKDFDITRLPDQVQSYVRRCSNLHDNLIDTAESRQVASTVY